MPLAASADSQQRNKESLCSDMPELPNFVFPVFRYFGISLFRYSGITKFRYKEKKPLDTSYPNTTHT